MKELPLEQQYAKKLARTHMPGWENVRDEAIEVSAMTGGLTNMLLLVSTKEPVATRQIILVRLFGKGSDMVINRSREQDVFQRLSDLGISPKLWATFNGGRIEEYIESSTLYGKEHEPQYAAQIAHELGKFHKAQIPGDRSPALFKRLDDWMQSAMRLEWRAGRAEKVAHFNLKQIAREVQTLKTRLSSVSSPVVFCHNDLLAANILLDTKGKVMFIDYEYGEYNYRAFDIANHFCEYAGFDCDYSRYPSRDAQYHFFASYLTTVHNGVAPTEAELAAMYREVNPFALAAHLSWGLWALLMGHTSNIDFDYLQYAEWRFNEYFRRRDSFFELIGSSHL